MSWPYYHYNKFLFIPGNIPCSEVCFNANTTTLLSPDECMSVGLHLSVLLLQPVRSFVSKVGFLQATCVMPCLFIQSDNPCISVALFRPFTFNINVSVVEVKPTILLLVFSLSHVFFSFGLILPVFF